MSTPTDPESSATSLNIEEIEASYAERGLVTKRFRETPGQYHEPHAHEGAWLFTTAGSAQVRLDEGDWQEVVAGQETRIEDDQLHEIRAGSEGWEYVFACSPQEAERQGIAG